MFCTVHVNPACENQCSFSLFDIHSRVNLCFFDTGGPDTHHKVLLNLSCSYLLYGTSQGVYCISVGAVRLMSFYVWKKDRERADHALPNCYLPLLSRCHGYSSPSPLSWRVWRDGAGEKWEEEKWLWLLPLRHIHSSAAESCPPFPLFLLHSSFSSSNLHTARSPPHLYLCLLSASAHSFLSLSRSPSLAHSLSAGAVSSVWLTWPDFSNERGHRRNLKVSVAMEDV